MNPVFTDSYKVSHWLMMPPLTSAMSAYLESRGGRYKELVTFGQQYKLLRYLTATVTKEDVDRARKLLHAHFGQEVFNYEGWLHIVQDHDGRVPCHIRALREGTVAPVGTPIMTMTSTCEQCFWVPNYIDPLLTQDWYPITVATNSREVKKLILRYLDATGDPSGIDFKLHDFGFRGASSVESAAIGGAAHLVNFKGTDNLPALLLLQDYYAEDCAGFSVPASEHSVHTTWGENGELKSFDHNLAMFPKGILAQVSDSYDLYRAVGKYWADQLKDKVLARQGTLVVRPDSGYPPHVVRDVMQILAKAFGTTTNSRGYRVLDPHVRVIQGDGISYDMIDEILHTLKVEGFSADNITFGMGGELLQKVNRDDQKFAAKASWAVVDGVEREVFKRPSTDPTKNSKAGQLAVILTESGYKTIPLASLGENTNQLVTAYLDGKVVNPQSFADIRKRAAMPIQMLLSAA